MGTGWEEVVDGGVVGEGHCGFMLSGFFPLNGEFAAEKKEDQEDDGSEKWH